jgi:hypothetical protein
MHSMIQNLILFYEFSQLGECFLSETKKNEKLMILRFSSPLLEKKRNYPCLDLGTPRSPVVVRVLKLFYSTFNTVAI